MERPEHGHVEILEGDDTRYAIRHPPKRHWQQLPWIEYAKGKEEQKQIIRCQEEGAAVIHMWSGLRRGTDAKESSQEDNQSNKSEGNLVDASYLE